jgi:hypothetical protein
MGHHRGRPIGRAEHLPHLVSGLPCAGSELEITEVFGA